MLHLREVVKVACKGLVLFCWVLVVNAEVLNGTIVGISDGDTIAVLDKLSKEHKVRLMALDAPEKSQAFGKETKKTLSNYIYKKEVSVDYKKLDKYKRIVGKVTLDGQDICLQMISVGMAWHYTKYEKEQSKTDRDLYRVAEAKVRELKIGLWFLNESVKPSILRLIQK